MKSWNELRELRASAAKEIALRNPGASAAAGPERLHVLVCAGTGMHISSSALDHGADAAAVNRPWSGSGSPRHQDRLFGLCQKGPIVAVYPDKIFYCHVKPDDVGEVLSNSTSSAGSR